MAKLTIAGHEFEVEDRYAEGHVLTANEASAMNQLRRENIRNNTASKVKAFVEGGGNAADFQDEITSIADAYEFGARAVGTGVSRDPVASEARTLARQAVNKALKAAGKKKEDFTEEQYNAAIAKAAENEAIVNLARERVAAKQNLGAVSLDELV